MVPHCIRLPTYYPHLIFVLFAHQGKGNLFGAGTLNYVTMIFVICLSFCKIKLTQFFHPKVEEYFTLWLEDRRRSFSTYCSFSELGSGIESIRLPMWRKSMNNSDKRTYFTFPFKGIVSRDKYF
jgi:hypothetical protein